MEADAKPPLFEAVGITRDYPGPRRSLFAPAEVTHALASVSLTIEQGQSLGLIGESGSGKSTFARIAVALERPDAGHVRLDGEDLFAAAPKRLRRLRRRLSMVFQDPYGSLDPRHRVGRIVGEPLKGLGIPLDRFQLAERIEAAVRSVGLPASALRRYPHEFSGGQRQRIAIARALVTEPELIVADEPVSALDVSVQAQILNLMGELRAARGVTYLFISHDLGVVRHIADRVAVLYLGRIVETGATAEVFARPAHPYTRALLEAVPVPDPGRRRTPKPPPPEPEAPPQGAACAFAPRCPKAEARCRAERPALAALGGGREAACFYPGG